MKPWSRDESLSLTLNIRSVSATDLYEYESQDRLSHDTREEPLRTNISTKHSRTYAKGFAGFGCQKTLKNEEGRESIYKEETRSGFSKLLPTFSENISRISEWNFEQLSPQVSLLLTRF